MEEQQKTKDRPEEESRNLINRLNRIEGQIRGIRGMVERSAYCTDILAQVRSEEHTSELQVAAANAALNAFGRELLAEHIRTCVVHDIQAGREETVDDLITILQKLMK